MVYMELLLRSKCQPTNATTTMKILSLKILKNAQICINISKT